ncbi:MAG: prepilin-type N-terminal cleavage/methylation domain-containing protein [Candidatus Omnitrophica bacterium]|nr:prepilin-type N-terminal cleavage/methylation domain-containing protein [Candidatus Omnitrophota bacterium]
MKKSFTLIELLIVVLIVGILATVALPQYQKVVEKARWAQAVSTLGAIYRAQEAYYLEHGDYQEFTGDTDANHEPYGLYLELKPLDICTTCCTKPRHWGDDYFSYQSHDGWGAPLYTDGWNCLASPHQWGHTPIIGLQLLIDFSENKLKMRNHDGVTWDDY